MKQLTLMTLLVLLLPVGAYATICSINSYFSPFDNIEDAVHAKLLLSKKSVHCSLFGISNEQLAQDLVTLKKKGIEVFVAEDKKQAALNADKHTFLKENGVSVEIKHSGILEHNKFCVIDDETVIMGSWNWSHSAQAQDNSDVIFTDCPKQADQFEAAFKRIWERDSLP